MIQAAFFPGGGRYDAAFSNLSSQPALPRLKDLSTKPLRTAWLCALSIAAATLWPAQAAHAALYDEIQVYTDDIDEPGEFGVELHSIFFPAGKRERAYPGEVTSHHSFYLTPELSYGLTRTLEVGFYLPLARDGATGNWYAPGAKPRIKWLPLKGDEAAGGLFAGANLEVGRVAKRFEAVRTNAELRIMLGWRDEDWRFGFNPVISKELSDNPSPRFGYGLGAKGTRRVGEGLALGLEYYSDRGEIGRTLPWNEQDNKLFVVLDYEAKPFAVSIGVGRGLTDAAEKTTLKAIWELPF